MSSTPTTEISADEFLAALDEAFCDAWDTNPRRWNCENGWVKVSETIEDDWTGDIVRYAGAIVEFDTRHHVLADEPQCYEGYPEYMGTVTYMGRTYEFHYNTWTADQNWKEITK